MKKLIATSLSFMFVSVGLFSQSPLPEPEFAGKAYLVVDGTDVVKLEKSIPQFKTKAGAGVYIAGISKVHTKLNLDGCCSSIRTVPGDVTLIVKAIDNNSDPMSVVQIFGMDSKKKVRKAELSSANAFRGNSSNNLDYIMFDGEKYGQTSYLIRIQGLTPGEYGVIVNNPNARDERATIVSTFGID